MSIKRISILLLLVVMVFSMVACSTDYTKEQSADALEKSIKATFEAPSSYITIKEQGTFKMKDSKGNVKMVKDKTTGKMVPATDTKLVTKYVINTYVTDDENYQKGTRLSELHMATYDEFGKQTKVMYRAGKEKMSKNNEAKQSYLIKIENDVYYRQKISNENIFEMPEFKQFDKYENEHLKPWANLKKDQYTVISGKKAGAVETIVIKIKKTDDPLLAKFSDKEFTIRITNGILSCIELTTKDEFGDSIVQYRIDYLLAGQFIEIPTTDALNKRNYTDKSTGKKVVGFVDNADIVKIA